MKRVAGLVLLLSVIAVHGCSSINSVEETAGSGFNGYQLSKWSRAVRARDGSCFMCGCRCKEECPCEAHHIAPKSKYPETAYSLWNGIALCRDCHDIVHSTKSNHKRYIPIFYTYTFSFEGPIP